MLHYRDYGRLWRVYVRSLFLYMTLRKLENALRTELAYRQRRIGLKSYPYHVNVEPLYYCNLACPLCDRQVFPEERAGDEQRLPLSVVERLLDEVDPYLFQFQIFGLGEPMLDWPRTKQIIEMAHQRRIFTLLSTNCTILTPIVAQELVVSGLDYLVCAIDGVSQESYQRYRVGGRVDIALRNLRLLAEERKRQKSPMEIEWQFLVHRHNEQEIPAAQQLANEIGVFLRFAPLRGMEFDPKLQADWLSGGPMWQDGSVPEGDTCSDAPCYFLWRSLIVNSRGETTRCPIYHNTARYGDLKESTVREVYNSPASQAARALFSPEAMAPGEFPAPCATCGFFKRVQGGPNRDKHHSISPVEARREPRPYRKTLPMA